MSTAETTEEVWALRELLVQEMTAKREAEAERDALRSEKTFLRARVASLETRLTSMATHISRNQRGSYSC